jgi:predicted nucleic acid-binding protein
MSRVFWDTNLFIYLVEAHPKYSQRVVELRRRMLKRRDQLYTSALTLGEVLVKPVETGNEALRRSYERAMTTGVVLISLDQDAARMYAQIRQDRSLRAPDTIQLACAAQAQVDLFITNDDRLSGKVVPGIQFIVSLEKAFL